MSNQAIIDNLEVLLAAVVAQPEEMFDLGTWRSKHTCGTICCVAGLASLMPRFQALGLGWNPVEAEPYFGNVSMWDGGGDTLFGVDSMDELFRPAGSGGLDDTIGFEKHYDDDWTYNGQSMTDRELAIARLEYRIKEYKDANEGK